MLQTEEPKLANAFPNNLYSDRESKDGRLYIKTIELLSLNTFTFESPLSLLSLEANPQKPSEPIQKFQERGV